MMMLPQGKSCSVINGNAIKFGNGKYQIALFGNTSVSFGLAMNIGQRRRKRHLKL